MAKTKRAWFALALVITCILAVWFLHAPHDGDDGPGYMPLPAKLRIGVLPDESPERLLQRYAPLLDHISRQLQITSELVIPGSYAELLSLFIEGEVDLAYFGGLTYIKAHQQADAVPLVMRIIDTRFTSYFIVSGDDPAETLQDLNGKDLSFGSRLSTSGHLMPRFFLQQQQIVPESFFGEIDYSGAHDQTAYRVRDGHRDVGAANAATIRAMFKDGRLVEGDIRILWETPPYANYVWAIQPEYDDSSRTRLRDAFLQLTPENDRHAVILSGVNARGFIPANNDFFKNLEQIAIEVDQLFPPNRE